MNHVRTLWPGGRWRFLWPVVPFLGWPLYCWAIGERRWEHAVFAAAVPWLAWQGPRTKRLFVGLLPLLSVGLVYDAMRFVKHLGITNDSVHGCDLRAFDGRWLGTGLLGLSTAPQSWPDYFREHASLGWDIVLAVPYGTFLYVTVAYAFWLYRRDHRSLQRFGWSFFAVNLAGYLTYHFFPAAPPWYVASHGCSVDLSHPASAGSHLTRVDDWLGLGYFAGFYGRSNDVFGAMPSLHVAYPLLVVLEGWRLHGWLGRSLALAFYLSMAVAAVYLDHHWVADVLAGSLYTVVAHRLVRRLLP